MLSDYITLLMMVRDYFWRTIIPHAYKSFSAAANSEYIQKISNHRIERDMME